MNDEDVAGLSSSRLLVAMSRDGTRGRLSLLAKRGRILLKPVLQSARPTSFIWPMLVAVLIPVVAVLALKETLAVAMGKPGQAMQSPPGEWPVLPYERMTQRLGGEVFDRATLRVPMIAQQVWGSGGCDRVDVVTIANQSTPRSVIYRVACHNGHQAQIAIDFTAQESRG